MSKLLPPANILNFKIYHGSFKSEKHKYILVGSFITTIYEEKYLQYGMIQKDEYPRFIFYQVLLLLFFHPFLRTQKKLS